MIIRFLTVLACALGALSGGAAAAQERYAAYGFDKPGYTVYGEEPVATAGVFMRYRPGAQHREKAAYGAAVTFNDGRTDVRPRSVELRFNGARPDALWVGGERELRVMGIDASPGRGALHTAAETVRLVGVGALLVGVTAVASNQTADPCEDQGGYLSASGCVSSNGP